MKKKFNLSLFLLISMLFVGANNSLRVEAADGAVSNEAVVGFYQSAEEPIPKEEPVPKEKEPIQKALSFGKPGLPQTGEAKPYSVTVIGLLIFGASALLFFFKRGKGAIE